MANWDAVSSVPATGVASRQSVIIEDDSPQVEWELVDQDRLFEVPEGRWIPDADRVTGCVLAERVGVLHSVGTGVAGAGATAQGHAALAGSLGTWGNDLLDALVALDEVGILHRDIKPVALGL